MAFSPSSHLSRNDAHETYTRWECYNCVGDIPPARIGHTMVCGSDGPSGGRFVYLYGGVNETLEHNSQYLDDFHVLDFQTRVWRKVPLHPADELTPVPRAFHTAVLYKGLMYVFGGCNGRGRFNKLFTIAPDGRWSDIETTVQPATRYCHSAVVFESKMYVFAGKCGGRNSNKRLSDLNAYDFETKSWEECAQSGNIPPSRSAHAAFVVGRKIMIFGGRNSAGECCEDLYEYSVDAQVWTSINCVGSLFGRARHSVVAHNNQAIIFGGWNGKKKLNDLFAYDVESRHVTASVEAVEATPSRRECHVSVLCGNTMIVFGGRFRGSFMSDTYVLRLQPKSLKDLCRDWVVQSRVRYEDEGLPTKVVAQLDQWTSIHMPPPKRIGNTAGADEDDDDEQGGSGSDEAPVGA